MTRRPSRAARGFTLIELMISMLLGLLVVGSVLGVLLANRRSYDTNNGLSQVQESARSAYELLAQEVRQADGTGCGNTTRTANVLDPSGLWWQNWIGLTAYDSTEVDPAVAMGGGIGQRVAGTDSIQLQSLSGAGLSIAQHDSAARRLDVDVAAADFVAGDIMLVCDVDHNAIFQASAVNPGAGIISVFHNDGVGAPGNCSQGLGFPSNCLSATGNTYTFPRNSQIGRLVMTDWYVGNNGRAAEGGRSLFRRRMGAGGVLVTEEIVSGITDMQLQFRANASDVIIADPSLVVDWATISSVFVTITVLSSDSNVSTDAAANDGRVQRQFSYLISLRNRLP